VQFKQCMKIYTHKHTFYTHCNPARSKQNPTN